MTLATNWQSLAATIALDGRAFVNGQRVSAIDSAVFDCISPLNGKKIADVARCTKVDVDAAVLNARAAFEDGPRRSHSSGDGESWQTKAVP